MSSNLQRTIDLWLYINKAYL